MAISVRSSNAAGYMTAMHPAQGWVRKADLGSRQRDEGGQAVSPANQKRVRKKNTAPLEGRAEPKFTGAGRLQGGTHNERGREEEERSVDV